MGEDESITTLSTLDRLKQLFETCLIPYLAETDYEDSAVEGRDSEEVLELIKTHNAKLKKFYKKYGGVNKSGYATIDVIEFMLALKDGKLIDAQLSFSKALDLFVKANQEEIDDYFNGMPDYKEVTDMSLEFDEFIDVV